MSSKYMKELSEEEKAAKKKVNDELKAERQRLRNIGFIDNEKTEEGIKFLSTIFVAHRHDIARQRQETAKKMGDKPYPKLERSLSSDFDGTMRRLSTARKRRR